MKKIVTVIGDMILYFVIVSVIGMVMKKFGWLEASVAEFAVCLTIGWCIWKAFSYGTKKKLEKK